MHTIQNTQPFLESFVNMTPWGYIPISASSSTMTACVYTFVTVDMPAPQIVETIHGIAISDLIAEREKDPRKAAALARARRKISGMIANEGSSIASLRLSKGMSQQQLANAMGVKQPYIARIERGEDVKISTVTGLASALGESTDVVFRAMENMLKTKERIE